MFTSPKSLDFNWAVHRYLSHFQHQPVSLEYLDSHALTSLACTLENFQVSSNSSKGIFYVKANGLIISENRSYDLLTIIVNNKSFNSKIMLDYQQNNKQFFAVII